MNTPQGTKVCTKCKRELPLSEFSRRAASKDGYGYQCKECDAANTKRSYQRRKEVIKRRDYYAQNKEAHQARVRANYEANKEYYTEHHRQYRTEHPEIGAAAGKRRRERLKSVERERYSRQEIIDRDTVNGVPICQICKLPITDINEIEVDHIIPIVAGGPDIKTNLRTVHRLCNIRRPRDGRDAKEK